MSYLSGFAIYFILWWVTLFAVLPFSLQTQDEAGERLLGTEPSAPKGPHMFRAVLRTTLISGVIFAGLFVVTRVYGIGFDDMPRLVPDFGHRA
jgi:predicted secreted protein